MKIVECEQHDGRVHIEDIERGECFRHSHCNQLYGRGRHDGGHIECVRLTDFYRERISVGTRVYPANVEARVT